MKDIIASKIDYIHISVPCSQPRLCKRQEHLYGSCGELHNREEERTNHCLGSENINIIIDNSTRRPFFNIKMKNKRAIVV